MGEYITTNERAARLSTALCAILPPASHYRPGTLAQLANPIGIVADGAGGAWFSEFASHIIRHIDANGTITRIAGNRTATYNGDNIPAVNASCVWLCQLSLSLPSSTYMHLPSSCSRIVCRPRQE